MIKNGLKNLIIISILTIFILNAALFGFVGGILGVLLGAIVSAMIPLMGLSIVGGGSMKAVFTVDLIFLLIYFNLSLMSKIVSIVFSMIEI